MTVPPPELSRAVAIDRIGGNWSHHSIEATADERAALAARLDLVEIVSLKAMVRLRRVRARSFVKLAASLEAEVVQTCVVSLEPFPARLTDELTMLFGPIAGSPADALEIEVSADLDEPEPLDGGSIDIGEVVAQQLSLALDPYPRHPDAGLELPAETPDPAAEPVDARRRPFADLAARLKGRGQG